MEQIALQISPESRSAYFSDYLEVARAELRHCLGIEDPAYIKKGSLEFFYLKGDEALSEKGQYLSFVQGVYAVEGDLLRPLEKEPSYLLHEDFVFGSKYRGKTNEHLTQMLINVGKAALKNGAAHQLKLLDPMCGRATTLLWAMRYGFKAYGIEQDAAALGDITRNLKKWTKLHRQKHKLSDGFIGAKNKSGKGKFIDFAIDEAFMRVATGDAKESALLYKKEKFDLIVSDLPYGVQHFTTHKTRNPLSAVEDAIEAWNSSLKSSGAIVLAFNSNIPKRKELIASFESRGFKADPFRAAHRMSESIVRDVVIFTKE